MERHSADYRTVAVFGSTPDAESARGLLESDGIFAAVQDAVDVVPAVRLLVPARDLDRARDLLAPDDPLPALDLEPAARPQEFDPTWTVAWLALLAAAVVALLAAFAL